MKQRSASTAERDARYAVERDAFLLEHPGCEATWDAACTQRATEVHHMGGRAPSVFFRRSWWLPSCSRCHQKITTNPAEAVERGLSFHTSVA